MLTEGQQGLASHPAAVCLPVIISHFSAFCDMLSQHLPIMLEKLSSAQATATFGKEIPITPQRETGAFNAKLVPNHEQLSAIKF